MDIEGLHHEILATGGLEQSTILLDIPVVEQQASTGDLSDRMEKKGIAFQDRVNAVWRWR